MPDPSPPISDPAPGPSPGTPAAAGGVALTRNHYVALDGLRGLAILAVIGYHFCLAHPGFRGHGNGPFLQLGQAGWMGVDLFFVLSGFLITGILLETRTQANYFRNFLARRFLRIWPLYYLTLVGLLLVVPAIVPSVPPEVASMQAKQSWFWLYGANWLFAREGGFSQTSGGYFWSLAVEEQFYVLWPLIVWLVSSRTLLVIAAALFVFALLARIVLAAHGVPLGALYTMTFTHWDGLAVGSILALGAESPALGARIRRWLPGVALAAAAGLVAVRLADGDFFFWSRQMSVYGFSLLALLGGALLAYVLAGAAGSRRARLFSNGFMRQAGKYSYALYLLHVPIVSATYPVVFRLLGAPAAGWRYELVFLGASGVAFAASWLGAFASWNLIEKHILSLKRYFEYDGAARSAPGSAR